MTTLLLIVLGGGVGAGFRHLTNVLAVRLLGTGFPFGTLTVNVLGSLLAGVAVGYLALAGDASQHWRTFLITGVLGGFTTFSAFSLDVALLYERGDRLLSALYVCATVAIAIAAMIGGFWLVRCFS